MKGIDKLPLLAAEYIITVPELVAEVRDKAARSQLESSISMGLGEFKVKTPSAEAVQAVAEFSRKTGDYSALSVVDLRVLALAYDVHVQRNGKDQLRTEPLQIVTQVGKQSPAETSEALKDDNKSVNEQINDISSEMDSVDISASAENDDDDGWITPSNIKKTSKKITEGLFGHDQNICVDVACTTTDFAMQNVLLQMRLNLVSIDGIHIKQIKNWVLRCHACFDITKNTDKKFCEKCGGHTLIRTSCAVDADTGELRLFLKRNFQYNVRGTKYTPPKPKGGRQTDLIFREDQKEFVRAMAHEKRAKEKLSKLEEDNADFEFGSVRSAALMNSGVRIGYGRKNPNVSRRKR